MPQARSRTRIDRLTLSLPFGSAEYARRVATLVAAGLAGADGLPAAGDVPTLCVTIESGPLPSPATLARRIVAATLRDLARTL